MYCPKCGKEIPDDARFCMHCGADLSGYKVEISPKIEVSPKMVQKVEFPRCPNCGNVLTDRNKQFSCQSCGKKICDTCVFLYRGLKLCEMCKIKKEEKEKRIQREKERIRAEVEIKAAPVLSAGINLLVTSIIMLFYMEQNLIAIKVWLVGFLIVLISSTVISFMFVGYLSKSVFIAGYIPYIFYLLCWIFGGVEVVAVLFFPFLLVGLLILTAGWILVMAILQTYYESKALRKE